VTKSKEDDVTLAVALCGVLGTAGVLFYVLAGPLLALERNVTERNRCFT